MIGAILAGGYGKRLKPITDEIPKALISIKDGQTIMDRQIYDFRNMGIRDVYILSGYLGEKIEERYGKSKDGMNFHYFREEKPMGTLYSIRNLFNNVWDQDIILRNGDTITDINFQRFIEFSRDSQYRMVMFVSKMRSPFGIVEMFGDQIVTFKEKPLLDYFINSGLYYIKKEAKEFFFLNYHEKDIETTVFPKMALAKTIGAYSEDALWLGIDSEKDLEAIRVEYSNRTDTPWGYIKTLYNDSGKGINEYFIKAEQDAPIRVFRKSILRIIQGMGTLNRKTDKIYKEKDIVVVENDITFQSMSNSKLELIYL
jgi:NDP-sugar pyrophosphorylase family protein